MLAASAVHAAASIQADWTETARFHDGTAALMQERPPLTMDPMVRLPTAQALKTYHSPSYQEILGIGGAFAEAEPTVVPASSSAAADAAAEPAPAAPAATGTASSSFPSASASDSASDSADRDHCR